MLEKSVSEAVVANVNSTQDNACSPAVTAVPSSTQCPRVIHRVQLDGFLRKLKGRFIGVDFVKQDGSVRALNGRLGVRSLCKGGVNKVVSDERPYLTVFDAKAHAYRTLNLSTVSALRADRQVYSIVG